MGYVLTSRNLVGRVEHVIARDRSLATYVALKALSEERELLGIQSSPGEWPLTIEDVKTTCANRAQWCCLYGANLYEREDALYEQASGD